MQKRNSAMTFPTQVIPSLLTGCLSFVCVAASCWLCLFYSTNNAYGQSEEVALMEQVQTLVDQLNSGVIEDRDAAQNELASLDSDALDYIDVPNKNATTDFIQRLLAVRKTLEAKAVQKATQPTTVSFDGEFSVEQALKQIASQTGNDIALREGVPQEVAQRPIKFDLKNAPFWQAVHEVMQQSNLEVDPYGGTAHSIVLVPRPQTAANPPAEDVDSEIAETSLSPPQTTTGILAVQVNRVDASRILNAPNLDYTTLNMLIRWEPRIQPISIELHQANLKIVDDQENTIMPLKKNPISAAVQTEIPELTFPVNIPLINRSVNSIKQITGTLDAVLPGRIEIFRFSELDKVEDGSSQSKSGATVTFGGIKANEELFGVTVGLSFDDQSNELDSHQSWTFENEAYLVDPNNARNRHESVAYETVAQNGQQVMVEYYFEVDPTPFDLVYQTPAAIVNVSFDFELNDIPLP